jgi:hypothetical protein
MKTLQNSVRKVAIFFVLLGTYLAFALLSIGSSYVDWHEAFWRHEVAHKTSALIEGDRILAMRDVNYFMNVARAWVARELAQAEERSSTLAERIEIDYARGRYDSRAVINARLEHSILWRRRIGLEQLKDLLARDIPAPRLRDLGRDRSSSSGQRTVAHTAVALEVHPNRQNDLDFLKAHQQLGEALYEPMASLYSRLPEDFQRKFKCPEQPSSKAAVERVMTEWGANREEARRLAEGLTEHPMKVALGRLFRREFSDLEMIAFGMAVTVDVLLLFAGLAMVSAKAWSRQQRRESAKKTKEAVDNILGWMTAMRDAFVQQIQGVEAHAQKVGEGVSQFVKEGDLLLKVKTEH